MRKKKEKTVTLRLTQDEALALRLFLETDKVPDPDDMTAGRRWYDRFQVQQKLAHQVDS